MAFELGSFIQDVPRLEEFSNPSAFSVYLQQAPVVSLTLCEIVGGEAVALSPALEAQAVLGPQIFSGDSLDQRQGNQNNAEYLLITSLVPPIYLDTNYLASQRGAGLHRLRSSLLVVEAISGAEVLGRFTFPFDNGERYCFAVSLAGYTDKRSYRALGRLMQLNVGLIWSRALELAQPKLHNAN